LSLATLVAACGGDGSGTGFGSGGSSGSGFGGGGSAGSGSGGAKGSGGGVPEAGTPHLTTDAAKPMDAADDSMADANECPLAATLAYVTGAGSLLYSFYPPKIPMGTAFTLIGTLTCLSTYGPTHMTVDRQATAWVVSNGEIYKASTKDASCSLAPTWKPHPLTFPDFGLTFIGTSNTVDTNLYLMSGTHLGLYDTATGGVTVIGPSPAPIGDMTSNGDGTLYYLYDTTKPTLFEVDPKNATVLQKTPIPGASGGGNQALAFWGGRFYVFEGTTIYEYDPKTNTTKNLGISPISATGAGQSTCVPKKPPPPPGPPK
jgi:hypothetical protein